MCSHFKHSEHWYIGILCMIMHIISFIFVYMHSAFLFCKKKKDPETRILLIFIRKIIYSVLNINLIYCI
jgi:hypothetical protein